MAASSKEMSTRINSVATATTQTTEYIQSIASAIEEMSSTIREIGSNTASGSSTTTKAVDVARQVSERIDALGKAAGET